MPIYCCEICKKTFELKTDYTRHINKKFKCKADDEPKNENIIKDDNDMYICNKCNKMFEYKSQYLIHINSKFSCIENDKTDANKEYNIISIEKKHNCINCQKSFTTMRSLNRHSIEFCKKKENNKENLLQLINVLQNKLNKKKIKIKFKICH